jgi:NAD(P)-dependent dehydrogenase (short-subunit alcohol dehydrogenase family)
MDSLQGKVAVITGAGSGFGREFARLGHVYGMRLVLADVQAETLAATADELRAKGARVLSMVVDVADRAQVFELVDRTYAEFGKANLVFNNAGVGAGGYLWESSESDWQWVMGVNVMGVLHGIQAFLPRILDANRSGEAGHIVNTASMAGWVNPPLMGVYNVSKHAVVSLTESLYHDLRLAGSSIGVSLLSPAFVPNRYHTVRAQPPDDAEQHRRAHGVAEDRESAFGESRRIGQDQCGRGREDDVRRGAQEPLLCLHASQDHALGARPLRGSACRRGTGRPARRKGGRRSAAIALSPC